MRAGEEHPPPAGRPWRPGRRLIALPAALLLLTALFAACSPVRTVETAAVLWDLADGPGGTGGHFLTPDPVVETVQVGPIMADIYRTGGDGPGMLLLPGLTPEGKDDWRLVDFAATMARAGFTVMVPGLSGRAELQAGTADVPEILAAVDHLSDLQGGRPVALGGISYAIGPAILAALEQPDRVALLLSLGGYHDMERMVAWITTGHRWEEGGWVRGDPPSLAVWWFVRGNLHLLDDESDRELLRILSIRRTNNPAAPAGDIIPRLGAEGQAVLDLLENRQPERVPDLMSALPPRLRAELEALDLSRHDLSRLGPVVLLVHGKDDPIIPWTESAALADAVGDAARLYLPERLGHTELEGLGDLRTLWRTIWDLLRERDRLARREPVQAGE